jgi:TRAP-type C4-dicarboxylate transport system substrate-binding protein
MPYLEVGFVKLKLVLFICLVWLVGCEQQQSNQTMWNMPTSFGDGVFHTKNIYQFAKEIEQGTQGKLKIEVYSGSSLYRQPDIKRAVRSGQVAMGETVLSLYGNENPIYQIDTLPLLATSYENARKLWQASREELENALAKQNLKLLFSVPWPPQGLYIKKEISSLTDMRSLKIRSYNAMLSRLVELMGGIPTTVESVDIAQAFSTGMIDSMMTSPSTGVSSQCWDYVHFYYDFQAWIPKNVVFVNKMFFESLPKTTQEVILKAAADAETRGWALSEQETESKLAIMKENGVKIMSPTDKLLNGLGEIRQQMAKEWEARAGASGARILKKYEELLNTPPPHPMNSM